jgi:hypothetical protein
MSLLVQGFATVREQCRTVPGAVLWAGIALVAYMPVHALVSTWGGTAIGPLWAWKAWPDVAVVALSLVILGWIIARRIFVQTMAQRLLWPVMVYGGVLVVAALLHGGGMVSDAVLAGLAMDGRYPLLFFALYIAALHQPTVAHLALKTGLLATVYGAAAVAVMGVAQVTVLPSDFLALFGYDKAQTIAPYVLVDDNPDVRRAFATLRGPNDFGAYLVVGLVAAIALRPRLWRWCVAIMGAGLAVSYSRSAWLGAVAALLVVVMAATSRLRVTRRMVYGFAGVLVALLLMAAASVAIPQVRLAVFHSSPGDSSLVEGSTDAHWRATSAGVWRVIADPLGCGPGCAGPASYYGPAPRISENYYVQIAEELGVIGLVVWLWMFGAIAVRLYLLRAYAPARIMVASGAGLAIIGVLLHVWADQPLAIVWWGLAAVACAHIARTR